MRFAARHGLLRAVLALLQLAYLSPLRAQEIEPAARAIEQDLQEVRALIRAGEHEAAIEAAKRAKAAVEAGPADPARLGQAYLLLVLSYVNYGNFQENDRRLQSAEIMNKEASALIRECLSHPELRYTQPDRESGEYPPEMIEMFDEVRAEMFGALRIIALDPPDARVTLDGVELTRLPDEDRLGDNAIPVGTHTITIERAGYVPRSEPLVITPNSWQERPYRLEKKRGKRFYAALGAGVAAVAGLIAIVASAGGTDSGTTQAPLPDPPPPPSR